MTRPDPEQHMVVIKTAAAWGTQARDAMAELGPFEHLADAADANYPAFCRLVEALYALGAPLAQDLLDRAQMVPVDQAVDGG
jgi:hypothetical protein